MKKQRFIQLLIALCLIVALIPVTAYAAEAGWVQNADNSWSYMQEDGELAKDCLVQIDGNWHGFDSNGHWLQNCVYQIGDYWYGFAPNGYLMQDCEFHIKGDIYRAKADGTLYVSEWYQSDGKWYYYCDNGKIARSAVLIDGVYRYFDRIYKHMLTDQLISTDEAPSSSYYLDSNGVGTKLDEGWNLLYNGEYVYVNNGRLRHGSIYEIDGVKYGFADNYYMYNDEFFEYLGDYYYAQPGGALLKNGWQAVYTDEDSEPLWYYFGNYYKALTGRQTIDGVKYYFETSESAKGVMRTNFIDEESEYSDELHKWVPVYYYYGSNGAGVKLQNEDWVLLDNGKWAYFSNGKLLKNCATTIGETLYLFDGNGFLMGKNEDALLKDSATNQSYYFRSKGEGIPYVNEWYAEYDENGNATWYYYGEGGRGFNGFTQLGDTYYFFNAESKMMTNHFCSYKNENYMTDENGIATKLNNNTWTMVSNKWVYYYSYQLYRDCVATIGGTRYLFDSNGYLAEEPTVGQFYDKDAAANYYFCTKTGGVVCVNEWAQPYLNDSSLTEAERNRWYYYGDSGRAAQGYTQLGSVAYYFGEDGEMLCNTTFEVEGYDENNHKVTDVYHCDENGIVTKTRISNWKQAGNGKWTYEKDGVLLSNCITEIDGATYAFDANGYMFDNEVFELSGTYYRAKAGGVLYTKGWYSERDANNTVTWYYYGEGGKISHGYTPIGTAAYYFGYDGKVITSTIVTDDNTGEIYHCAKNGVVTKINANGWTQISYYDWYYFENGVKHTGWLDWNGSRFYMDENGLMVTGWLEFDGAWYYLKSDGRMAKGGWIGVGNLLYYLDENGVMQTGWLQYDGKWYYLSAGGTMSRGWVNIGRTMYYFDDDGVMQTGWLKYEDEWYYLDEYGAKHTGWLLQDEIWYYMDVAGVMQTGIVTIDGQNHAFTFSGVWLGEVNLKSSWFNVDGTWVYFDENGDLTYGWLQLGDYWYAFNEYGHMITGFASDGVNFYYLDNSGVMQTGWELIDGYWHYFHENGVMHFGWLQLDGHWYVFNGDGQMLTGFVKDSSNSYYLAESGVMQTGWIQAEGYWFYAHENGALEHGWLELDGAKYYFDKYGRMLTGSQYINGYWYYFDNNGVLRN